MGFQSGKVAIGFVECVLRRGQVRLFAGYGIALHEQPAGVDIGHHAFGSHRRSRKRHALGACLKREIAAEAGREKAQQHDRHIGRGDGPELLADRLVRQPAVEAPSRIAVILFAGVSNRTDTDRIGEVDVGRAFLFGGHAAGDILQSAHATLLPLSWDFCDRPMGLPRCWAMSFAGIALK